MSDMFEIEAMMIPSNIRDKDTLYISSNNSQN